MNRGHSRLAGNNPRKIKKANKKPASNGHSYTVDTHLQIQPDPTNLRFVGDYGRQRVQCGKKPLYKPVGLQFLTERAQKSIT